MTNLYWPIYKNLEHEVIELSTKIHFDDEQLNVYSVKISELLIRCSVEIEAISKDLYFKNGGIEPNDRDLYFDTDCINLLDKLWNLSSKKVIVSSSNFYFQGIDNKILNPLKKANKRGSSSSDWKKAYQAVKHNRTKNLNQGNIKNLIRAMAALFILNIYYKDEIFELMHNNNDSFASGLSELFNIKVHLWRGDNIGNENPYVKSLDFEECIYLIKWTNQTREKYSEWATEFNKITNELILAHPKVKSFINNNLIENGRIKQDEYSNFISKRKFFDHIDKKIEYPNMLSNAHRQASKNKNYDYNTRKFEAILNKNQNIYS
jgi:hypothetical protein